MAGRRFGFVGDQPEGAKVVVRRRVEVHQALLPQLHHRDCGEGLGDGCDAKDGVLGDRRPRCDISQAVPVEPRQVTVTDHRDGQSGRGPAVEYLSDRRLEVEVINRAVRHGGATSDRSV